MQNQLKTYFCCVLKLDIVEIGCNWLLVGNDSYKVVGKIGIVMRICMDCFD